MQRLLLSIVCVLLLSVCGGCNIVGFVASAVPQKIEAKYVPPKTPMLVLVENQQNPGMAIAEADQLTGFICDELAAYEVAPLVEQKKLTKLRDSNENANRMTISQIGKAVGAEQVLYVDLRRLNVSGMRDGIPSHGRIEAVVRVVDVKTGKTVFPAMGQSGWPISMETPMAALGQRDVNEDAIRESLLFSAGTAIGRLFHDYTVQQ